MFVSGATGTGKTNSLGSEVERMSTLERVQQSIWWPTKLSETRKDYVGSAACARCHSSEVDSAKKTEMAKALLRPQDSEFLQAHGGDTFELDSFLYKLETTPEGYGFTASRGGRSAKLPITWAFGVGAISQVYFTESEGKYYESHFSYFPGIHGFDRTTNQGRPANSIETATGRVVSPDETRRCFACHATAVTASGDFEQVEMGVQCEACHGPGADHVAAMKSGVPASAGLIVNPAVMNPTGSVDFCGSCHMTWVDVEMADVTGPATVRFPAYGLENSRCWGQGDARITCTACHDPHKPLVRGAAAYDDKCLACHVTRAAPLAKDHPGSACPESTRNCASCHMPKQQFDSSHHSFTDHDIRVVRAGN
jgi:hypothetical protein